MLAEGVKTDYKDFLAATIALFRLLLPMIVIIILAMVLLSIIFFHS